jgi:hypothetical protein
MNQRVLPGDEARELAIVVDIDRVLGFGEQIPSRLKNRPEGQPQGAYRKEIMTHS